MAAFDIRILRIAPALALCAAMALPACAARDAMERHASLEDPWVEGQPYPRLVDSPPAPAPGEFTAATPDPARGQRIIDELGAVALENSIRGAALSTGAAQPAP